MRQHRILQIEQAQSEQTLEKPELTQDAKITVAPSGDEEMAKDNPSVRKRATSTTDTDTKPPVNADAKVELPAKPPTTASTRTKKTPPSKTSKVKKLNKRGVKKTTRKRRSEKKAPKVEIVDPFANP